MTGADITIRSAETTDINAMTALLKQLFAIEKDFEFKAENHKKGLLLMLEGCGKHKTVKLAVRNTEVVGMCTAQTRISTASGEVTAILEDMVIDEKHRGRGIGCMLIRHMETWAKSRGIRRLQLLVDAENQPALSFYIRNHWKTTQLFCLIRSL